MNHHKYFDRFDQHTVKRFPSGRQIHSFFFYRPGTTEDAFNIVMSLGRIYVAETWTGGLILHPCEGDPWAWLKENIDSPRALFDAVPDNLSPALALLDLNRVDSLTAEVEDVASFSHGDTEHREEAQELVDWFQSCRESGTQVPLAVALDRIMNTALYEHGVIDETDVFDRLDFTEDFYIIQAALHRFVEILDEKGRYPTYS